ncbi:DUF1850 domain-containing protein [Benzoatithermus flavus]|uniref:DUF1850 domain-containing protein n=1 Tax=Benzoatithermus flavus TaxID=3108223 RepID=A0ABU8XL71_9PROT
MALCLAAGAVTVRLALAAFTLAWTHSVEKVRWEEDWRIENGALVLAEARVQGSGAGMEPPEGAVFAGGFWHYRPDLPPLPRLELARSGAVPDWSLCHDGLCAELGALLPGETAGRSVVLGPCPG